MGFRDVNSKQSITVVGLDETKAILEDLLPNEARNILRATVLGMASTIAKEARANAPQGKTGALKKAIKSRRNARKRDTADEITASVTVDGSAFYWRFVEWGTGAGKGSHKPFLDGGEGVVTGNARPYMQPAIDKIKGNFPALINEQFTKKLTKFYEKKAKKLALPSP